MGGTAEEVGRKAEDGDWLDPAVRFGLVAYGIVYLLMAWLAAQLALGDYAGSVSKGPFKTLAEQPFGAGLLVAVAVGMFLLVVWRLLDAGFGHRDEDGLGLWRLRATDVGKAGIYAAIGYKAVQTGLGDSGGSTRQTTARLMDLPLGVWIVGAVGVVVGSYGAAQVWIGFTEKHREKLAGDGRSGTAGSAYLLLGTVGYVSRGIAFIMVGGLFIYAAVTHEPKESGGLDGALRKLLDQPYGRWLLLAMAAGFACYGLFNLVRARHLSR